MDIEESGTDTYVNILGKHGTKLLRSKNADWILAAISFSESLFAPIIIDPFLIAYILAKRERWLRFIVISVVFSVLGGLVAYWLGVTFFDTVGYPILHFYGLDDQFGKMTSGLDANGGFVFVLLGALTPVPYKLIAIASGLVKIDFLTFLFASIFGRIVRLGLVGLVAYTAGPRALPVIRKHLLTLAYMFFGLLILYMVLQFI